MTELGQLGLSMPSRDLEEGAIPHIGAAAEDAGYSSVFVAERLADAYALCQQVLAATSAVTVGTAVTNARLRHPVVAAMTAMTLARQSNGRFVAGLGVANSALNEVRLGLPSVKPLLWLSEYVEVFRATCSGLPVSHRGTYFQLDAVTVDIEPIAVPVHLAALGPRMIELAGRVADGVILNLCPVDGAVSAVRQVQAGSLARPPGASNPEIACVIPCCVSKDRRAANEAARGVIVDYVMHPSGSQIFGAASSPSTVARIQAMLKSEGREAAIAQVPQGLADQFVAIGSPSQCAERLWQLSEAGIDTPIVFPRPVDGGWSDAVMAVPHEFSKGSPSTKSIRMIRPPTSEGSSTVSVVV